MVNIQFNKYYVENEKVDELSPLAYDLLRTESGLTTGGQLGEVLYLHYVKGLPANEIFKLFRFIPFLKIKSICNGKSNYLSYLIFMEMLDKEPEVLDKMFMTTVRRGESI